jgi:hypothetical protein
MARQRHDGIIALVALGLLAAYVLQASLGLEVSWLVHMQEGTRYRALTGLLLAGYLVFQARLGARRLRDPAGSVSRHKIYGAFAPLVLYVHTSRFGYGYLLVLVMMYLGTMLFGLLHRPVLALHARTLFTVWFVMHVAMSTLLIVFGAYHVAVALAYE